jgi:negative regulator of flagellin synthesis FlgM
MKVYGNQPPEKQDVVARTQKAGKPEQALEKGAIEKIAPIDRVDLSGQARGMSEMFSAIKQLPEIRTEKVQEIAKALNDGAYKVDPNKVASRMIDELV